MPEQLGAAPAWRDLAGAVRFYSRLPAGRGEHEPPRLDAIARVLPIASLIIVAGPALVLVVADMAGLPPLLGAAIATASGIAVTGAMAEDALADAMDGLFGGADRERRLEIMRDSRHGTYGVCALALLVLMRVAALAALLAASAWTAAALWLAATIVSRSGALWLAAALPPARPEGAATAAGTVTRAGFWWGMGLAALLAAAAAIPFATLEGWAAGLFATLLVMAGWTALCRRLVGGATGDLIGAGQALLEIAALTAFILFV